jgi:peptidoglycan LD-endopeptidase LytH
MILNHYFLPSRSCGKHATGMPNIIPIARVIVSTCMFLVFADGVLSSIPVQSDGHALFFHEVLAESDVHTGLSTAPTSTIASTTRRAPSKKGKEPTVLLVPVLGVAPSALIDTWGDARSHGRTHEGIDIVAQRGTPVIAPADGVVVRVGVNPLGGRVIFTKHKGGESYYFAHLEGIKKGIRRGTRIKAGQVIGYVGDSGNAKGTGTHLHFGIYRGRKAHNPFLRLSLTLPPDKERVIRDSEHRYAKK